MKDLVILKNKQALTTSLKVAEYFEKRHDNVIQAIEREYGDLLEFKEMFFQTTYPDSYGRPQPMYNMNRDGFFMLVTGFKGKKANAVKLAFIKAFNRMEEILRNWQNEQWIESRQATRVGALEQGDSVHELWLYSKENGSKVPEERLHQNFHKLINKTLGIDPNSRDTLPVWKLFEIDKLQFMAKTIIDDSLEKGVDYHQPYQDCKQAFENYARLSYIPERLQAGVVS